MRLPFLCEKPRATAPVLPGLMAGYPAGWLADEILLNIENFLKLYTR